MEYNGVKIYRHEVSSIFFDAAVLLLSSTVTGPSFMLISWLVLELWHFLFIKDWSEIQKSEIPQLSFAQYLETSLS